MGEQARLVYEAELSTVKPVPPMEPTALVSAAPGVDGAPAANDEEATTAPEPIEVSGSD